MTGNARKPTVCIDAFNIALPEGSGIATYGRNLLTNLKALGHETSVLYGPQAGRSKDAVLNEVALVDAAPSPKGRGKAFRNVVRRFTDLGLGRAAFPVPPTGEVIWPRSGGGRPDTEMFWSSRRLFEDANQRFRASRRTTDVAFLPGAPAPDVMHWTTVLPLRAPGRPNIYTIHDLIPLRLPHTTLDNKRAFLAMCRRIVRDADRIAVVSEATRRDVIRLLGAPEDKVVTTYQSVSIPREVMTRSADDAARDLEGIFGLGWKNYFLYFGAIEPKKNLGRIIEGHLASGARAPLVVIGGRAWLSDKETALLKTIQQRLKNADNRILQLDYLPYSMLMTLVRGARATLFPSLYEGFGLPVLESMLLGTAVLTSTAGSLPEVAGDAALLVDPYDANAISAGIRRLDADEALRADLETRGQVQAALFDEAAYQARLRELYAPFLR